MMFCNTISYQNPKPTIVLLKTENISTYTGLNGTYKEICIDLSEYGEQITTEQIFVELVSYNIGSSEVGGGSTAPTTMSIEKNISNNILKIRIPIVTYFWNPRNYGVYDMVFNIYLVI